MSKARDIASAAPAPSTVSATEIGYLDGVTSAIQTQIDSKQAANANVSTTELGYLDGVTSAIQTQLDAKIPKTLTTTTGDIIYASSANTPARLGLGTAGQVLTVNSGATAPEWATAAGGGSMTLIADGSLSGSTLDLTSISSSYRHLQLLLRNASPVNDTTLIARLNNSSSEIYNYVQMYQNNGTYATSAAITASSFPVTSATGQNPQYGSLVMNIYNYGTSAHKNVTIQYNFLNNGGQVCNNYVVGAFRTDNAVTRIVLIPGSGNWSTGTYELFGVK